MKRKPFVALLFAAVIAFSPLGFPSQEPPPAEPQRLTVADLTWMAGRWAGEKDGAWVEEVWTAPEAGCMIGMSRIIQKGQPVFYEFGAIEQGAAGPVLRLAHFDPGLKAWEEKGAPMTWETISWQKQEVVFRRTDGGNKETLTYRRDGPDQLLVILEKRVDGKNVRTGFLYKKAG